ncbi:4Fe-4S dicluster domain-containing protein, partial [bacterium]
RPRWRRPELGGGLGRPRSARRAARRAGSGRSGWDGGELPRPLTKMTWDNVVLLSPRDAQELGVVTDDKVRVTLNGGRVHGAAFVLPGQPVGVTTIHLGYGRTAGGTLATVGVDNEGDQGGGFNAYKLKSGLAANYAGLKVERTGGQTNLASTQGHSPLGGNRIPDERDVIREANLADYLAQGAPALIQGHSMDPEEIKEANLYPEEIFEWHGDQWGMTIDMNTCVGCNACVTACQAENNISVVGKEQVGRNREMHWIRIDRYYSGTDENPAVTWQPIACVHCEKAPCEPVCPVAATVHSHEGLNQMVYNRCVGTRYCSNNCPYKVRRFNYLNYSDNQPMFAEKTGWDTRKVPGPMHEQKAQGREMLKMINNPRVTVRGRGVMEKCTYCVQRINEARIEAKKTGRAIADGEIVTACQQACPAGAIVFGNIADKKSQVSALRADPRSYLLLEELQTRPRTSHLAKLRNPNPEIAPALAGGAA